MMREGEPSQTARRVAAHRLSFERPAASFGDPQAEQRLARDVSAGVQIDPEGAMARYLRLRTAFFDRVVLNGLERGNTQVVVIGAGYDGRALRYAKPGVHWLEVDHPDTQRDKRRRLEQLGIATPQVAFVAADLAAGDVAARLLAAGFEPDAPSLLLCEGVAVYLAPEVVAALLAQLRSLATAGTRLALSAGMPGADPAARERFAARVAALGEPVALGGTDVRRLLTEARWRTAELSERAQRGGMLVGIPVWEPGVVRTAARVGRYLEGMSHRAGLDTLAGHLGETYGIAVTGIHRLDVGVGRVDRSDGPAWVARVFPAARPVKLAHRDARMLGHLADSGYPAERLAAPEAVSEHEGQAVLVTEFISGSAPRDTRATFRELGELLGRLHTLPDPPPGAGGAWHHLACRGGPEAEIAALRELMDARGHVPEDWRPALSALRAEVDELDDLHDLPAAITHPDFVPANAIATPGGGQTIVDWTGAGSAPRLWTLGFLCWAAGRAGLAHIDAVAQGYRSRVELEALELQRLEAAIGARPLIFDAWA